MYARRFPFRLFGARCGTAERQKLLRELPLGAGDDGGPFADAYFLPVVDGYCGDARVLKL
jgi:hypothetical protein